MCGASDGSACCGVSWLPWCLIVEWCFLGVLPDSSYLQHNREGIQALLPPKDRDCNATKHFLSYLLKHTSHLNSNQ